MKDNDPDKPLDELMQPGSTVMFGLASGATGIEFRPLTVARVEGDRIDILLDTHEAWVADLNDGDRADVTLSDTRTNTWASLHGPTSITTNQQLIDELWNSFAGAYFEDGRDTPGIAVLTVEAESGRYWTSPSGRIGSVISFVKAKLGDPEQSGEHGDIAV